MPEIIDPVFAKTSQNARFLLSENERFGLVFVKTGSINSGTGQVVWSVRADGMDRPYITSKITKSHPAWGLGHSPLASQAGRHVGPVL